MESFSVKLGMISQGRSGILVSEIEKYFAKVEEESLSLQLVLIYQGRKGILVREIGYSSLRLKRNFSHCN